MSRETPPGHWATELREILGAVERAADVLRDAKQWLWQNLSASDVIPPQLREDLKSRLEVLERELDTIRESADSAFERYASEPSRKLLTRSPLTREEYYVYRAMGVEQLGPTNLDDYEAYHREISRTLAQQDDLVLPRSQNQSVITREQAIRIATEPGPWP